MSITFRLSVPLWAKKRKYGIFDGHIVEAAPFLRDDTVETTGAGDTFCACLLHDVLEHGINDRKDDDEKDAHIRKCGSFSYYYEKGAHFA